MDVRPITGPSLSNVRPVKAAAPAARVVRTRAPPKDDQDKGEAEEEPLRAANPPGVGENLDILV